MSRKQVTSAELVETSMDRVWASLASKLAALAPPYALAIVVGLLAAVFHGLWGHGLAAAWAVLAMTLCTVVLTGVTWLVSHQRSLLGRTSATATTLLAGLWTAAATIAGPAQPVVGGLGVIGGLTVCLAWNIRHVIRAKLAGAAVMDPLAFLFDAHKAKAGLDGAAMKTVNADERKIDAAMALPAGQKTVEDVQKKAEYIEGAMGLPPGTMTISPDLDRADRAHVVLSDPRVIRNPIAWPGPSRPGASIAEPIRPGVWQDLEDAELTIPGTHIQVMGMTGSGKSIGCCWNTLAELATRPDVMVLAIDLVKGRQTLGPMEESLHRLEVDEAGARALIGQLQAKLVERTNYLADKGLTRWKKGCGLIYIVVWVEEAWKLFEVMSDEEMDAFEELMKALRSAGGSVIYSLQRGDHTQAPTMIKGQSAYWCFGLASAHDARWGLSEKQQEAGASPELWGSDQPGMSYLHAPGIDKARIAMPLRTFDWAEDTDAIRAHCAHYPASAKTVDAISASLVRLPGGQEPDITTPEPSADLRADEDDHELLLQAAELVITTQRASRQMIGRKLRIPAAQADRILHELARHEIVGPDQGDSGTCPVLVEPAAAEEVLTILRGQDPADSHQTPDPDPSVRAELDDEITDPPDDRQFTFGAPEGKKMLPAAAKKVLLAQIETWRAEADRERFATRDLKPVWTRTGLSRAWVQARLKELVKEGALGYDDAAQEFLIHPSA